MMPAPQPADRDQIRETVLDLGSGGGIDVLLSARRVGPASQAGCIAGAPSFAEYREGLSRAGFTGITITPTRQVGDGVHAAIIRAARP